MLRNAVGGLDPEFDCRPWQTLPVRSEGHREGGPPEARADGLALLPPLSPHPQAGEAGSKQEQ
jgi:hypothetical protein